MRRPVGSEEDMLGGRTVVTDGYFHLPDGPGWGVEVDLDFLKEHEAEMVDGVIQDPGLNMYRSTSWNLRSKKADI